MIIFYMSNRQSLMNVLILNIYLLYLFKIIYYHIEFISAQHQESSTPVLWEVFWHSLLFFS